MGSNQSGPPPGSMPGGATNAMGGVLHQKLQKMVQVLLPKVTCSTSTLQYKHPAVQVRCLYVSELGWYVLIVALHRQQLVPTDVMRNVVEACGAAQSRMADFLSSCLLCRPTGWRLSIRRRTSRMCSIRSIESTSGRTSPINPTFLTHSGGVPPIQYAVLLVLPTLPGYQPI